MARDEQKYEIQNDLIVERELHNELKPNSNISHKANPLLKGNEVPNCLYKPQVASGGCRSGPTDIHPDGPNSA